MKVIVYGAINIDLIFSVDHIAKPGETVSAGKFERSAGGKGSNQAAALAKAGLPVYLAGKIGNDGEFLLELLRSYGVDTSLVAHYEGATGNALIQVDKNGQNAIVPFAGGNGAITIEEIDSVLGRFEAGDIIILQNEIVHAGEIIAMAKKRGMKVIFNPSPYDETIAAMPLESVDTFFINEIEGAAMAGLDSAKDPGKIIDTLVQRFPAAEIVLTLGKDGALYGCGEERARGDIIDLPVVDTTGAGDTFSGYFVASRVKGMSVKEALRIACKAASIAVTRKGAMAAVPAASDIF
jgi:ribokinase